MEERKKPTRPFSVIYADAKQALTRQVGNTMAAYGLPIFMAEGILSGILAEIRTNAGNELADDTARYEEELKEYYEAQIRESRTDPDVRGASCSGGNRRTGNDRNRRGSI